MAFNDLPEQEQKFILTLLRDSRKMFELAKEKPDVFEHYEEKIYKLADAPLGAGSGGANPPG